MSLSIEKWHARFVQQAGWSHTLRHYLLKQAGLTPGARVLEVGCGTGAALSDLPTGFVLTGIDLDLARLGFARELLPGAHLAAADAHLLPIATGSVEAAFCHYLLLWVGQPRQVLAEMRRVTRSGGWVFAFSEPDYGGRLDSPAGLEALGAAQRESLISQGANPTLGRVLPGLFAEAGLASVQWGVLGSERRGLAAPEEVDMEWAVLRADLAPHMQAATLDVLESLDRKAWSTGERVLFVPTFYAAGQVP
ncbi:MAG: methyltransferase domain-containing protein [Chloroflexi bacterium]|nr:methyltransferase domain-containing protein [Chloroflexota bacterium]